MIQAEMEAAMAEQKFELCAQLRDEMNKLEATQSGSGWDQSKYDEGMATLDRKMKTALARQKFEDCAAIRDQRKELEALKSRNDDGDSSAAAELFALVQSFS